MIVDCHTHIDFSAEETGTSAHLAAAETVDVCVVLGMAEGSSSEVNKKLSGYVSKRRSRMVGFAVVYPTEDRVSVSSLGVIKEKLGLPGVVLYCSECGFHPAHSRAMRMYESLSELKMPVFFHNAEPVPKRKAILEYAQPYLLDEIAREFPELKIVVGSMGVPFVEQTLWLVAKHKNVYADLTIQPSSVWRIYNTVVAAHESGVMDKLLFGSGFPVSTASRCMETLLGFNMLLADTNLPTVPRNEIRSVIERETLRVLGIGGVIASEAEGKAASGADRKKERVKESQGVEN